MWLPIDEKYEVSIEGQIRNKRTSRILKCWTAGAGYLYARTGGANAPKKAVHRVVAERFLPTPTEHCEVDHIDRDKTNNNASNLRWVSKSENQQNKCVETRGRLGKEQHHIKVIKNGDWNATYVVMFDHTHLKHYSSHKSLVDAIKKRDEIINAQGTRHL